MNAAESALPAHKQGSLAVFVQYFVHLLIVWHCVGSLVPAVNESHYLPKAKHAWDTSYAPGDLFLESHDSHFLASAVAGLAARLLPLIGVAWLGRLVCWTFMAFAWVRLTRSLNMSAILSPLALIAWFLAMEYGHWAGEWAIGGFEAKSIAYPCILMALAAMIQQRWAAVWIWLGSAVAWHPVVGGWAGLSVGLLWLSLPDLQQRLRAQAVWLAVATGIGLIGVIPAAGGLGGVDQIGKVAAAQVHVYYRLAHHMCPRTFAFERQLAAAASLSALAISTWAWLRWQPRGERRPISWLLSVAWISVAFSVCGLAIDLLLTETRPDIAAKLLRFYWFRWSDVAVPLAWTLTAMMLVQRFAFRTSNASQVTLSPAGTPLIGGLLLGLSLVFGWHIRQDWDRSVPEADQLMAQVDTTYEIDTNRYLDWLSVCAWIRENTPEDSLWLTPKYQQTFKWYAQRAEVVCWKDVPQDNASLFEWYDRVRRCEPPRDANGRIRDWNTDELIALAEEFDSPWILLDRGFQQKPPLLEIVYPIGIENRSFAVCRVPPAYLEDAKKTR